MTRMVFAAMLLAGMSGCTVYQSTGPDPNARPELTPVCHGGTRTLRLEDDAVRVHLNHGDTLGECE